MEEVCETWAPDTLNYRNFFNASVSGDMQAMQEILATGEINVNACQDWRDWEGEMALHRAAEYGHLQLVRLLISYGADIDRRDHSPVGPKQPCTLPLTMVTLLLSKSSYRMVLM